MSDRIPMTRAGYDKLRAELDRMENVEMPELEDRVADLGRHMKSGRLDQLKPGEDPKQKALYLVSSGMMVERTPSYTLASGLLASTKRITVFGTVHAPLFHPLIAAKEFVTADHVGRGRFGLNIVAGWNEDEFEMFGVQQRDHEARYEYAQDWIDAIRMAWSSEDDVNFDGKYLKLSHVRSKPKPYGGTRPDRKSAV